MACDLVFLTASLEKVFNLDEVDIYNFSFILHSFKKYLSNSLSQRFYAVFSSRILLVLTQTFKSIIYFKS